MVDVLMLATLGDTNLDELLALSQEYDVIKTKRAQSFFSNRTIYDATAYTLASADGDEAAFLGHVDLSPRGRLGFDPWAVLSGDVAGASFHDFFASEIGQGHDARTIWADLLGGDDVVIGNGKGSDLFGFDGNDVLLATGPSGPPQGNTNVLGGSGDDLIFLGPGGYLGEEGADTFVATTRDYPGLIVDFKHAVDTILLDRTAFAEVGKRVTQDNFHVGPRAADADDRIIVYGPDPNSTYREVYFDPDGKGGTEQQLFVTLYTDHELSSEDFALGNTAKLIPDVSKLFASAPAFPDASGAEQYAVVAPLETAPLVHHGFIQLA